MDNTPSKKSKSAFLRFGKKYLRPTLNRWLAQQSLIMTTPILDSATMGWTADLEANWLLIQAECDALLLDRESIPPLGEVAAKFRRVAPDTKWRSFFFEAHGYVVEANRARCPHTARLLDSIPDLVTAFFSVMEPETHIIDHEGLTKALLNFHLGLRIPAGIEGCRIAVAGEIHGWKEGEFLAFDESFRHEVWNDSNLLRAVLFIQVMRPMRLWGRVLARTLLEVVSYTKYVRQGRQSMNATRKRKGGSPVAFEEEGIAPGPPRQDPGSGPEGDNESIFQELSSVA